MFLTIALALLAGCADSNDTVDVNVPPENKYDFSVPAYPPQSIRLIDPKDESEACPNDTIHPDFLTRIIAALENPTNRSKFIYWSDEYGNDQNDPRNVYVVYIVNGKRYTIWNNSAQNRQGWLAVWQRPNGTHTQKHLITYSDDNHTGCVNFGVGSQYLLGNDRMLMRWNENIAYDEGVNYHQFWQKQYNDAIRGLAITLNVKPESVEE